MKKSSETFGYLWGFTLAEVLAALTIGSMILVAVLGIYSRVEKGAAAIRRRLDRSRAPFEVLQRISEDLDRIVAPVSDSKLADTEITIENKFNNLYQSARLTIVRTIYDARDQKETFEEIIWQSSFDYDSDANGLVLYRSHRGMAVEDKLLEEGREAWEKDYSFVPICSGVSFFKIEVPVGESVQDSWAGDSLPKGIIVTVSFAEPYKTVEGTLDVPDAEKVVRTIAVDRARRIAFTVTKEQEQEEDELGEQEGQDSQGDEDSEVVEDEQE
jgi:hypothetical protein